MTSDASISIVIPAYNAAKYIDRTLSSAIGQTYQDREIIIVDDGSTDDTAKISATFADQYKNLSIIRVPNGGVASARNVGLQAAKGRFVAFLDSDDLWHPAKLALQVKALTESAMEGVAAIYTRMRIIDEDDCVIRNGSGNGTTGYSFTRHIYAKPVGNGSSLLVRRDVALEVGGFDPGWLHRGVGGCEDLDFELKIAANYPMIALPQYLVGYRSHPENMSSNRLALARSVVATVGHHLELHPSLPYWAVQKIQASTVESAVQLIAFERRWQPLAAHLVQLHRIDPRRALTYTARLSARKLVRDILGIKKNSHNFSIRPAFSSLEPDDNAGPAARPRKDARTLAALSTVDTHWHDKNCYR